jgi:hypothetical protein
MHGLDIRTLFRTLLPSLISLPFAMNTSGGFLLEPSQGDAGPSRARQDAVNTEEEEEGSVNARKLSAKQEVRLMNYLDEEFLQINRGFNKR